MPKITTFQENTQRNGKAEHLFLKYDQCGNITALDTSRRLGGHGEGAHEVNRRSVIAAHHMGLASLTKFCGRMDLPPPLTSKAYNNQLRRSTTFEKLNFGEICQTAIIFFLVSLVYLFL